MTLRGVARGSILYSIGFVLPRIGAFLLLPIYVTVLSTADFGAIALVTSVAQLVATVLRMGMDGALMRMHFDSADPERQDRLIATVATMTAVVATLGALLAGALAYLFFEALFAGLEFVPYGATAAALSFSVTFQYFPATVFRAREQPARFVAFTGGIFLVTAVVTVVLLLVLDLGVVGALAGQLAGGVFVVAVSALMLLRAGGPAIDPTLARGALNFGLPLVPHALAGWLLNVSDRWLLSFLLPLPAAAARSAIGVYSLGYQLAYAIDLLAQSFNAAWVPFFYRYGATPQGPRILREMTTLTMAAFSAIAAVLAINATLVVTVIASPDFAEAADLIPILAPAFVAHVFYIAVVTVIFHERRTRILPLITAAAAGVNVLANIVLIPRIGIVGAAWATLVAFVFMAVATTIAAGRVYRLELDWLRLVALFAVVVAASAFALASGDHLDLERVVVDIGASAVVALIALVVALAPAGSLRSLTRAAAREPAAAGEAPG